MLRQESPTMPAMPFDTDNKTSSNDISEPLQIVSLQRLSNRHGLTLKEANFNSILDQIPSNYKISIISIVGAFRTGKSFFLNFLLKFLNDTFEKKHTNEGFQYRHGRNPHTMGIWMWHRPFLSHKHKIAILLIDTQGLFDLNTDQNRTVQLFGISSLISSMLIYNTDKKIQEDNLQQIALFSEYGRMVSAMNSNRSKPFNDLLFLIRDWQHFNDDWHNVNNKKEPITHHQPQQSIQDQSIQEQSIHQQSMHQQYMREVMLNKTNHDQTSTRQQIINCYQSINCFCLPHPGTKVANGSFTGNLDEVDPFFLHKINQFMVTMMQTLKVKTIMNRPLHKHDLKHCLVKYIDIFQTEQLPQPLTILNATISIQHHTIMNAIVEEFRNKLDHVVHHKTITNKELFVAYLNEEKRNCLGRFRSSVSIGSHDQIQFSIDELQTKLDILTQKYFAFHHIRNNSVFFAKMKPVMVILLSFFMCRFATQGITMLPLPRNVRVVMHWISRLLNATILVFIGVVLFEVFCGAIHVLKPLL